MPLPSKQTTLATILTVWETRKFFDVVTGRVCNTQGRIDIGAQTEVVQGKPCSLSRCAETLFVVDRRKPVLTTNNVSAHRDKLQRYLWLTAGSQC